MVEKVVGKVALRKDPPTEETPKEREVREKALAAFPPKFPTASKRSINFFIAIDWSVAA